jgi:hypothetical protein
MLRICAEADEKRLGRPCPETEHKVANRSQGMCGQCLFKRVTEK